MVAVQWAARWPFCFAQLLRALQRYSCCFCEFKSAVKMLLSFIDSEIIRNRYVFPLPLLAVPHIQKQTLSRSVRLPLCKQVHVVERSNDAISCLNEIFCQPYGCNSDVSSNSIACSDYLRSCMQEYVPSCSVVPQEALTSLLGSQCHSSYSHEDELASTTLVAYQPGHTSLPCATTPPPQVIGMLDNAAAHFLIEFEKEMMMDPTSYEKVIQAEVRSNRISCLRR